MDAEVPEIEHGSTHVDAGGHQIDLVRLELVDDRAAEHCGEIRALLEREGRPIGPYDLQIAAIARTADLCLVTRNVLEFSRVPGLRIENWQDAT